MQQPAPAQSPSMPSGFAELLATLASPNSEPAADELLWSSSDLGKDAASLSYERALRTHARYRPAERRADRDGAHRSIDRGNPLPIASSRAESRMGADTAPGDAEADAAPLSGSAANRDLRLASVTIRLSKAECARLHARAAEAGLTISAYLRSCALEAEVLRAQVKQALAEMKAGSTNPENKRAREQGSKQPASNGSQGVRLTRIVAHIGRLWLGLSPGKPA